MSSILSLITYSGKIAFGLLLLILLAIVFAMIGYFLIGGLMFALKALFATEPSFKTGESPRAVSVTEHRITGAFGFIVISLLIVGYISIVANTIASHLPISTLIANWVR